MRKYTDLETTPLKFHTFIRFVFFPLGMLVTLANVFLLLPYMGTNFAALVAVPLYIAYFIASLACVIGFGQWKSYAWYALLWALGLRVVDQLLASGLDFYAGVSSLDIASEIIGCLIANGLIFLYYYKRRALFFQSPALQPVETAEPVQAPALVAVTSNSETVQPDMPVPMSDVPSSTPRPAPKRSKPQPLAVASVILAVAVVALLALNVYQYNTVSDLESQLYTQGQELTNVKADLTKAEHDIISMKNALLYEADSIEYIANHGTTAYSQARIVPDDGSGLFHRVNCISLDSLELVLSPVLDRQTAQDLGFSPCPLCDDVNSLAFQEYAKNSNSVFDFVDRVRNADDQEWWTWCEVASEMLKQNK